MQSMIRVRGNFERPSTTMNHDEVQQRHIRDRQLFGYFFKAKTMALVRLVAHPGPKRCTSLLYHRALSSCQVPLLIISAPVGHLVWTFFQAKPVYTITPSTPCHAQCVKVPFASRTCASNRFEISRISLRISIERGSKQ